MYLYKNTSTLNKNYSYQLVLHIYNIIIYKKYYYYILNNIFSWTAQDYSAIVYILSYIYYILILLIIL